MIVLSVTPPNRKPCVGSGRIQSTTDPLVITGDAFNLHRGFNRAGLHREIDAGSRCMQILYDPAPQRLDRHSVLSGVQQIDDAGFRIMPQRDFQRVVSDDSSKIFRIPMRQRGLTPNRTVGAVEHRHYNRGGTIRPPNDARIGHICFASRQCRKGSGPNAKGNKEQISVHNVRPWATQQ